MNLETEERHDPIEVILVAENASAEFGGESILPLHYFVRLHRRGVPVKLVVHERVREELAEHHPDLMGSIEFIDDNWLQVGLNALGKLLPLRLRDHTVLVLISFSTARRQRQAVKRLVSSGFGDIIHQPTPVSPRAPSFMYGFGKPVIIGPVNGGMDYPPGFKRLETRLEGLVLKLGRQAAVMLNTLIPGKPNAALVLGANERSLQALPDNCSDQREIMVENGVDLALWQIPEHSNSNEDRVSFVHLGRLIELKMVHILVQALELVEENIVLEIIGDGPEKDRLETLAQELGVSERVRFHGFLPQRECVAHIQSSRALLLPSVRECGGAVVLEAMACARPVVATNWGGPTDYLDEACGILVDPDSEPSMIAAFADAMKKLAADEHLAKTLGGSGRMKVERDFDWNKKIDAIIAKYSTLAGK